MRVTQKAFFGFISAVFAALAMVALWQDRTGSGAVSIGAAVAFALLMNLDRLQHL